MNETQTFEQPYVFGLDIGTRNVVGTVGYKEGNEFIVVAQYVMRAWGAAEGDDGWTDS